MKIGFIKDENNKEKKVERNEKLKVIWEIEDKKKKDVPLVEEVPLVKEEIKYEDTFNLRVFMELINNYNVKMEYALRFSVDKEFCVNFIVNKTRGIGVLNEDYRVYRRDFLKAEINKLLDAICVLKRRIAKNSLSCDIRKNNVIDCIINGKEIIKKNVAGVEMRNKEKLLITERINQIKDILRELDEIGYHQMKKEYQILVENLIEQNK